MKRQHPHLIVRIVFGLIALLLCSSLESERAGSQVKEPPIPIVIGKEQAKTQASGGQSIVMTVADFNYLMAREDSLRQAIVRQNETLQQESRSRSYLVYALVLLIVVSNIVTALIVRRRSAGTKRTDEKKALS